MIKALFLAPDRMAAEFWAREWGYDYRDWRYISQRRDLEGVRRDLPLFVCGPAGGHPLRWLDSIVELADARGLRMIDAQDIDAIERHRLGLFDVLPAALS